MKTKLFIKDQKGAALVEFAIVLPLLALLAGGVVEFGMLLYNQQVLTNASREGARAAIILGTQWKENPEIKTIVTTYCNGRLVTFQGSANVDPGDIDIECEGTLCDRTAASFQDNISVKVSYDYYFLLPSLLNFDIPKKTLTAKTTMKLEQTPPTT